MKILFSTLLAFLSLITLAQAQESLPDLVKKIRPSVVTVAVNRKDNVAEKGSGFFVELPASSTSRQIEDVTAFARRIRNKTDDYYDIKDTELVRRVLEKYPEYIDKVKFPSSIENKSPKITLVNSSSKGAFIVTNWHIVKDAKSITITTQDKQTFKASVVSYSELGDIVLLQTDAPKDKYSSLEIAETYPEQGENVIVLGNPLGMFEGSVSTGIISATRNLPDIGEVLQITAPVSPGSSGSPVFDSEGKVIGIVTFGIDKGQNLNFAISKRLLERLLCPQDPVGLYR